MASHLGERANRADRRHGQQLQEDLVANLHPAKPQIAEPRALGKLQDLFAGGGGVLFEG